MLKIVSFSKMKVSVKIILLSFFLFSIAFIKAQNLVPNSSFEIYDTCPTNQGQIQYALGWSTYRDFAPYFNACSIPSYIYDPSSAGVPANGGGYQFAATGSAYIGMFTYVHQTSDDRGAAGCQLSAPLIIGTKYYVSFMVSLSAIDSSEYYNTASDHIGALFSTVPYSISSPSPKNNFAQVYSTTIITDTLNWTKVSGSFIADSAYKYIAIGNFFDDAHTNVFFFYSEPGGGDSSAVYFVDDVCVSSDSLTCNSILSIDDFKKNGLNINIFPNPANEYFEIEINETAQLTIYNSLGSKVVEQELIKGNNIINTYNFKSSIYFLDIKNNNQEVISKKIIINK